MINFSSNQLKNTTKIDSRKKGLNVFILYFFILRRRAFNLKIITVYDVVIIINGRNKVRISKNHSNQKSLRGQQVYFSSWLDNCLLRIVKFTWISDNSFKLELRGIILKPLWRARKLYNNHSRPKFCAEFESELSFFFLC